MDLLPTTGDSTQLLVIGGEAAKGLAAHLAETWNVRLLSDDKEVVRSARSADSEQFDVRHLDLEADDLQPHVGDVDTAVVGTDRDRAGLMVAQVLTTVCGVDRVLVGVNDPKNEDAFQDVDCETIETWSLLRSEVERVLSPGDG